jgi:hypothetical protein
MNRPGCIGGASLAAERSNIILLLEARQYAAICVVTSNMWPLTSTLTNPERPDTALANRTTRKSRARLPAPVDAKYQRADEKGD